MIKHIQSSSNVHFFVRTTFAVLFERKENSIYHFFEINKLNQLDIKRFNDLSSFLILINKLTDLNQRFAQLKSKSQIKSDMRKT